MVVATAMLTIVSVGFLAQPASAATYQTIAGAGSTWAQDAINTWVSAVAQTGLPVNYAGVGSTAGRADFRSGVVNFAASEIPYGVQDGTNFDPPPTRGYAYVPDVAGGLAFMYNLVIGGQRVTNLRLSGAVVAAIFTNQITMWNDPKIAADNPGLTLPPTGIIPVVRTDGSSDSYELTHWMVATQTSYWTAYCQVVGRNPCTATSAYPVQSGTAMIGQPGDVGVSGYVSQVQNNGAIGFVAYSSALESGFPVAKVLNAAGYYTAPTPGNVGVSLLAAQINQNQSDPLYLTADLSGVYTDTDPRTYELSYYSYLIVPTDTSEPLTATQGFSLGAFGSYLLCQGQQQVDNLGYSALPINLVEDGYTQLQKIPGASVPTTTSAFIQSCNNPTFSPDGTNKLASSDPMPPPCDQQGAVQCNATGTSVPVDTSTTVTASPSPVTVGEAVTLTATVAPTSGPQPAGSVQFEVGGALIGTPVALNVSGAASTTTTFTMAGTQVVSAVFTPTQTAAYNGSVGTISVVAVTPADATGITVTTTVPPMGSLTFTVTSTNTVTMTVSGNTATGMMNSVVVSDTRNTYPGWSVVGQATDFIPTDSNPEIPISGNQLGWAPLGTLADGVVLGGGVTPAAPGLSTTAAVLASAPAGTGFGTSTLGAELLLAIPPTAPSGPYTSTLTLTANPAAP